MPVTMHKSFKVFPGVRLNVNRRSISWTFGAKGGPKYTRSSTGRDTMSMNLLGPFGWRRSRRRR